MLEDEKVSGKSMRSRKGANSLLPVGENKGGHPHGAENPEAGKRSCRGPTGAAAH